MKPLRLIVLAAAAVLLLTAWLVTVRVPEGTLAVRTGRGPQDEPRVYAAGIHFVVPGTPLTFHSLSPATSSGEILVTPSTGGEVPIRFTVSGRLDPSRAAGLHAAIGEAPFENFLSSQTSGLLRQLASRAEAVELLTPGFRTQAGEAAAAALRQSGILDAAVSLKPTDDTTLLSAAQYLIGTREAGRIRMTVAEALLDPARAQSWQLLTAMGLVNESDRLLKEAETNYLDALAASPTALPPMSQLVAIYSTVGELDKLRRILDAALAVEPKSLQHLNWAAMVLMRLDQAEPAERLFKEAIALDPANATIQANLAGLYLKTGRMEEAIALLRQVVQASPDYSQALFNLGAALAATDRHQEALSWLEKAEAASSMTPALARTLMMVHERLGHAPAAATYRNRLRELEAEAASRRGPRREGEPGKAAPAGPS